MNYYNEIKNQIINNEITKKIKDFSKNKNDLESYYNVGKLLTDAGKHYGEGIIKEYSRKLTIDLGKGYTPTRLRYYRRFYSVFSKCPTLSDKLTYSHYCEIIWLDNNEMNEPWYGQLMRKTSFLAYLYQIDYWYKKYNIRIDLVE